MEEADDERVGRWSQRFGRGLRQLGGSLLDLFLPRLCAGCTSAWLLSREGFWCRECHETLPWIKSPRCPLCGRPFPDSPSSPDHLCGDCLLLEYPFDTARSATLYVGTVRERIHQLKFGGQLHWAPALADLLTTTIRAEGMTSVDLILPVPLHARRLRQRGFNQVGILAKMLSRRLAVPADFRSLGRRHWTQPQTRLNRQERLQNVKGAFQVDRATRIEGKRILLLDDVITTGTTISECALTLKNAGAAAVHALTISRAMPGLKSYEIHES